MSPEQSEILISDIANSGATMVGSDLFRTIYRHHEQISKLNGDVVECGVWKGGMSIYLSKLFFNKNIWVVDSYKGFQDLSEAKHDYPSDPHTPIYTYLAVDLDTVKSYFKQLDALDEPRIKFLEGYVRNTLVPDVCPINNISLLRVDVDAYSATLEVLEYLYPKVVSGGYIIFDDYCLTSASSAIKHYFNTNNIKQTFYHPVSDELLDNGEHPQGIYFIKP